MYIIKIVGHATPPAGGVPLVGQFIKSADVDAHGGRGEVSTTILADQARRFSTAAAAQAAWKQQSTTLPFRPDGKPNRPLTAYHVEILPAPAPVRK